VQKARVVSEDERESGLREILNFGHTFAHALESATRYRKYLHGEAVGWGMIAASRLAVEKGMLSPSDEERIARMIASVGPLPVWTSIPAAKLIAAMQADKKTRAGRLRFVLPEGIGAVRCGVEAQDEMLVRVLRECAIAAAQTKTRKIVRK
jgi:3-dehydroquinate synthase